ncbi:MAG: hypothetical protein ACKUBY_03970 [Candidatus Moraniibacteriota bacterium]|jgi:H+/Cl- antiporter ClcA
MTKEVQNQEKEKKDRIYAVWGIVIGSFLGLLLTLFANAYYDVFVTGNESWGTIDHRQVYSWVAMIIAIWGFLGFFIYDYKNNLNVNIAFWKRFFKYFFQKSTPSRIIRIITGLYVLLIIICVLVLIYIYTVEKFGFWIATSIYVIVIINEYIREKKKK